MKLKIPFAIIVVLLYAAKCLAQPVCNESLYKAQHGAYQHINSLIDNACAALNAKNYPEAQRLLSEAVHLDSLQSNGHPNAVLVQELNNLRAYTGKNDNEAASKESKGFFGNKKKKENAAPAPKPEEKQVAKTETKKEEKKLEEKERKGFFGTRKEKEPATTAEVTSTPTENKAEAPPKEEPVKSTEVAPTPEKMNEPEQKPAPKEAEKAIVDPKVVETKPAPKTNTSPGSKSFTPEQLKEFQNKGLQKLRQLEGHIQIIAKKSTPLEISSQAITNALRLFDNPDERVVEVSSINRPDKVNLAVKKYLEKLRQLNYEHVDIEWADFQYTSEFIKGDDGFYHGYVIFRQRFTASKDDRPVYTDITTKRTEIIIKSYSKAEEGVATENYDVFLGDISVDQTQKN